MTSIRDCTCGGGGGLLVCQDGTNCNGGGHISSATTSENQMTTGKDTHSLIIDMRGKMAMIKLRKSLVTIAVLGFICKP